MTRTLKDARGQSVIEISLLMPLVLVVALGVIEFGYALLDQHVVTKLTREGSNLISRDTTIDDAVTAMRSMSTRPVDFTTRSRVIFSVLKKGSTTGTVNYDQVILYQRHEYGSTVGSGSALQMRGSRHLRLGAELCRGQLRHQLGTADLQSAVVSGCDARRAGLRHRDLIRPTTCSLPSIASESRCRTRCTRSPISSSGRSTLYDDSSSA